MTRSKRTKPAADAATPSSPVADERSGVALLPAAKEARHPGPHPVLVERFAMTAPIAKPSHRVTVTGAQVEVDVSTGKVIVTVGDIVCACPLMKSTVNRIVEREEALRSARGRS